MKQIIAIIDGTLSKLDNGEETHAGKLFKLALRLPPKSRQIFYDPGVQGRGVNKWWHVASGVGLNRAIAKIYLKISQNYQDGDKIYLFGYSRGAYAVRLIAGMIDRIGLLSPDQATLKNAKHALKLYAHAQSEPAALEAFEDKNCSPDIQIEFLGVWETVSAIGLPLPFLHHFSPMKVEFKDSTVPRSVKFARHALAIDENRWMYEPELWDKAHPTTSMKQVRFRGDHAVVGGNVHFIQSARGLGNLSFHWMMDQAKDADFELSVGWQSQFPTDPCAPLHDQSVWYEHIWFRRRRKMALGPYLKDHSSVEERVNCP